MWLEWCIKKNKNALTRIRLFSQLSKSLSLLWSLCNVVSHEERSRVWLTKYSSRKSIGFLFFCICKASFLSSCCLLSAPQIPGYLPLTCFTLLSCLSYLVWVNVDNPKDAITIMLKNGSPNAANGWFRNVLLINDVVLDWLYGFDWTAHTLEYFYCLCSILQVGIL